MIARARPQWALIAAFLLTIAHLILTAKGVRVQVPVYWLVPLVYAITAFFQYDDPDIFKATCQLALSYAPVLMTSLFRSFVGYIPSVLYYSVHIVAFLAQALLRCLGLRGYWRRQEHALYSAAFSATIAYTLSEVVLMLTLWFDGPHNAEPIRLSARVSSAALALQLLQLIFLAAIAIWPPPLRLIVRENHQKGGASSAASGTAVGGMDGHGGDPGTGRMDVGAHGAGPLGAGGNPAGAFGPESVAGGPLAPGADAANASAAGDAGTHSGGVYVPGGGENPFNLVGNPGGGFAPGGGGFAPGSTGSGPPPGGGAYPPGGNGSVYRVDAAGTFLADDADLPDLGDMPDLENPDDRIDEVALWRRMGRRMGNTHGDGGIGGDGGSGNGPHVGG